MTATNISVKVSLENEKKVIDKSSLSRQQFDKKTSGETQCQH